jgi:hypothetical protein
VIGDPETTATTVRFRCVLAGAVQCGSPLEGSARLRGAASAFPRQHFLYFLPLPQGQGSLRPIFVERAGPRSAARRSAQSRRSFSTWELVRHGGGGNAPLLATQAKQLSCSPGLRKQARMRSRPFVSALADAGPPLARAPPLPRNRCSRGSRFATAASEGTRAATPSREGLESSPFMAFFSIPSRAVLQEKNGSASTHFGAAGGLPTVKKNVAPPATTASAQTRPPWRSMTRWTVASPMPVPGNSASR